MNDIRSFLKYVGFYSRFIKDFSKTAKPLSSLLAKDFLFHFSKECELVLMNLKDTLTMAPILHPPVWGESFEPMCDALGYAVRVVLDNGLIRSPI